ncbi:uncharacterized protein LOC129218267 [Uloborus diversus]|uniref:uncharacterized protein LOC129218267 n=1 Tax=Uloborus diversus TaxID=327109 RepID=UPI0024096329|nr:uncharacterized protein LOC129218267 [Uloborus diversus]
MLQKPLKYSKRVVLQTAAKCFDPAGFISPFLIRIKCIVQELWEMGLDWDETFNSEIRKKWSEWCSELNVLRHFSIPRYYFTHSSEVVEETLQLHIFSDATPKAYGAVAYFRFISKNNVIETSFVMSKSRVAPLKKITLPRLELMGAVIAARLGKYLENLFSVHTIFLWTDSTITFCWIKGSASKWKPFVSNRTVEIQDLTCPQTWRFCDIKSNAADFISRGCKAEELISNRKWLHGPAWLSENEELWPKLQLKESEIDLEAERKNVRNCTAINLVHSGQEKFNLLTKFSSWSKLLRVTAWCLRFITNLKLKSVSVTKRDYLTCEELKKASEVIIRIIQEEEFSEEIKCLKEGKPITSNSKISSLNPFIDKSGILRVGGRLKNAEIAESQKYPILLPKGNFITNLIIKSYHEKHLHCGVQLLLFLLREEFWIINARIEIKK